MRVHVYARTCVCVYGLWTHTRARTHTKPSARIQRTSTRYHPHARPHTQTHSRKQYTKVHRHTHTYTYTHTKTHRYTHTNPHLHNAHARSQTQNCNVCVEPLGDVGDGERGNPFTLTHTERADTHIESDTPPLPSPHTHTHTRTQKHTGTHRQVHTCVTPMPAVNSKTAMSLLGP